MPKPAQPPAPKFRVHINLLHPNEIPAPLPSRFLKWLITYGRYIVIVTEMIVVAAFVYRFKLDADLDELKRKINKDLPYVEGFSNVEAEIKQTQLKLATAKSVYTTTPDWQKTMQSITSEQPKKIRITSINLEPVPKSTDIKIKFNGNTLSNNDLAVFVRRLKDKKTKKAENVFQNISLDSVNIDQNQLIFTISGIYKSLENKP